MTTKLWVTTLNTHLFGDVAVLVDVVEVKSPVELLGDRSSEQHGEANDKVLKADGAVSVKVEGIEQEVSVGGSICGQKILWFFFW